MLNISQSVLTSSARSLPGWSRLSGCAAKAAPGLRKAAATTPRPLCGASRPNSRYFMTGTKEAVTKMIAFSKELTYAFWNGGKQLYKNYQVSKQLQKKAESGETLTRAQHRFIAQTSSDIWKLLPVLLINLLPGSVVLLGIYIAAIPSALPSTIRISAWVEKAKLSERQAKQEGSKGILDFVATLPNSTPETNEYDYVLTKESRSTITAVTTKSKNKVYVTAEEVRSLSKPFETVMDVTEMEKPMVMASARLVGVPVFSFLPTPFNLARLTKHFAHISKDDNMVLALPGGIDDLTDEELDEYLMERGLIPDDLTRPQKVTWAKDWLKLSKDPSIVPSIYLLFSACNVNSAIPNETAHVSTNLV